MNFLEQKIRKQMIDESIRDRAAGLRDAAKGGLAIGKAKLAGGIEKAKERAKTSKAGQKLGSAIEAGKERRAKSKARAAERRAESKARAEERKAQKAEIKSRQELQDRLSGGKNLDPSIKVSDPRFGTKDGMKPTLASDVLGGIKKAAKATKDTLLKQQVGQQADAYADALNIGGGRRMGPQIGATGLRTDREKGVANIRTGIKQQVGVVTQTDDQGNVKGAKAGVLNPQRILRRIKARQAQKQQDDILNRANRAAEQGDVSGYARELKKVFSDKRVDLPTVSIPVRDMEGKPTGRYREGGFGTDFGEPRRKPSDLGTFVRLQTSLARKRQEIDKETTGMDRDTRAAMAEIGKREKELSKAEKSGDVAADTLADMRKKLDAFKTSEGERATAAAKRLERLKKGARRGEEEQARILSRTRAGRAARGEDELNQILSKQVTDPDSTREFDVALPSGDKITIRQKM